MWRALTSDVQDKWQRAAVVGRQQCHIDQASDIQQLLAQMRVWEQSQAATLHDNQDVPIALRRCRFSPQQLHELQFVIQSLSNSSLLSQSRVDTMSQEQEQALSGSDSRTPNTQGSPPEGHFLLA
eukprot:735670-Amphidinium_carterae.1